MQVEQHLEAVLVAEAQRPLELLHRAIGAAGEWLVRFVHPVADRDPHGIRPGRGNRRDVLLLHPSLPVASKLQVSLLWAEDLAEGVHVDCSLVCDGFQGQLFARFDWHSRVAAITRHHELVEERRRDPRLKHQPSAEASAEHLPIPTLRVVIAAVADVGFRAALRKAIRVGFGPQTGASRGIRIARTCFLPLEFVTVATVCF